MVNHIQTLLLNESAAAVSRLDRSCYGFIDPAFTATNPDKAVSRIYEELFSGCRGVSDKLAVVRMLLPLMYDPEFSSCAAAFDTRTVGYPKAPSSVFVFHGSLSDRSMPIHLVDSPNAPLAFTPTGNGPMDEMLDGIRETYRKSKETTRRLTALLYAVAAHMEASRFRRIGL